MIPAPEQHFEIRFGFPRLLIIFGSWGAGLRFAALIVAPGRGELWLSKGVCSQKKPFCELSGGSAPPGLSLGDTGGPQELPQHWEFLVKLCQAGLASSSWLVSESTSSTPPTLSNMEYLSLVIAAVLQALQKHLLRQDVQSLCLWIPLDEDSLFVPLPIFSYSHLLK